jgi:hypothetical protein
MLASNFPFWKCSFDPCGSELKGKGQVCWRWTPESSGWLLSSEDLEPPCLHLWLCVLSLPQANSSLEMGDGVLSDIYPTPAPLSHT